MNQSRTTIAPPKPALPEIRERRCPSCQTEQIEPAGRVVAGGGMVKEEVRCAACQTGFWFVKLSLS